VEYYDSFGSGIAGRCLRISGGGMYRLPFGTLRGWLGGFSAWDVYYEQEAAFALGITALPRLGAGVQVRGWRVGVRSAESRATTALCAGGSASVVWQRFALSIVVRDIPLYADLDRGLLPQTSMRLHGATSRSRFGAQAVALEALAMRDWQLRLRIMQQIWLIDRLSISGGMVTNPLEFGIGVTLGAGPLSAVGALGYHPVLGWSRGVDMMIGPRPAN
jgi:hypothetical protein